MISVESNVTASKQFIILQMDALEGKGEASNDFLVKLFKARLRC